MGLQTAPGYIGQGGFQTPVELDRNFAAALAGRRTGAFRYNDFALTPSGSAMQMTIARGEAVILGNASSTTQGGYFAWSNASEVLNWPASAGSPRIDSLILRIIDTQYGVDAGGNQATWQIVSGTPSGSPVAVADSAFAVGGPNYRPGAWWRVADVLVPASVTNLSTATITYTRKYARLGGRTLALSTDLPSDGQIGDRVTLIDTGAKFMTELTYDGAGWKSSGELGSWQAFPFAAGYTGASGLSSEYSASYRVIGNRVELRGSVQNSGATALTVGANFTVGTLPVGARPAATVLSWGVSQFGTANPPLVRREIQNNGNVIMYLPYSATWVSLDGMEFYTS